jgi:hypothetical protein
MSATCSITCPEADR